MPTWILLAPCRVTVPVVPEVTAAFSVTVPPPEASASAKNKTLAAPVLEERLITLLTIILFAALRVRDVLALAAVGVSKSSLFSLLSSAFLLTVVSAGEFELDSATFSSVSWLAWSALSMSSDEDDSDFFCIGDSFISSLLSFVLLGVLDSADETGNVRDVRTAERVVVVPADEEDEETTALVDVTVECGAQAVVDSRMELFVTTRDFESGSLECNELWSLRER